MTLDLTKNPIKGIHPDLVDPATDRIRVITEGSSINPLPSKDQAGNVARNTVTQEAMVALRNDYINVQFQYNVPVNEDSSDINGATTGTGAITHNVSKAVVGSGAGIGSAYVVSKDSIRYFPGHEFYGEMTGHTVDLSASGIANTVSRWGIGDPGAGYSGAVGDAMCFGQKDGVFGLFFRSGGIEQFIPQANWNGDKLDGTGNSGFDLAADNLNLWTFRGGWYGILPLQWGIFATGFGYITCHTIDQTNQQSGTHLENPTLPMFIESIRDSGSGDDIKVESASWRGGIAGPKPSGTKADRTQQFSVEQKSISAGAAPTPVLSIRNKTTFQGKQNHVRVRYGTVTLAVDGTKPVVWEVFKDGVLTGAVFADKNPVTSVTEWDDQATAITPVDTNIGGTVMSKTSTTRINLFEGDVVLAAYPGETITLCARSTGNTVVDLFFREIEEF